MTCYKDCIALQLLLRLVYCISHALQSVHKVAKICVVSLSLLGQCYGCLLTATLEVFDYFVLLVKLNLETLYSMFILVCCAV